LVSLRHSWLNRTSGTTGIFRQARLAISAFIVAATFLSPIIFKMAAPAWAFANERFILWINLIWLETVALWTVFVDNKRIQADGTRVPYWFATAALTTGIAGTILFRLSDLTPSILIICLSLLLSLTVFVFYGIHSGQIGPKALSGREGNTRSAVAATFGLTARETEIVQLIVDGNSNNEIAQKLFISLKTVESHLYNIFRKMKVTSRVQIVSLILGAKG